jgi:UPF0716 protein FxsA
VAIEVGRAIGAPATLGLLVLISVVGTVLVRVQGLAAWRSLNRSLRAGEPPSPDLANAATRVVAGMLLILPGFVTDVVAALLLLPLTRSVVRRPLERSFRAAAQQRVTLLGTFPAGYGRGTTGRGPGYSRPDVVEGEIIEDDAIQDDVIEDDDPPAR